jgi:hypothetical protein
LKETGVYNKRMEINLDKLFVNEILVIDHLYGWWIFSWKRGVSFCQSHHASFQLSLKGGAPAALQVGILTQQ